jgi:hypothetical protein
MSKWMTYLVVLALVLPLSSCKIYSLSEGKIPPEIKSVSVYNFGNISLNGSSQVAQRLTDALKERFIQQTNLHLLDAGGDIEFKGVITSYEIRGNAPTANETSAINRLTITVKVEFTNNTSTKETDSWTQSFSRFAEYPSTQNLIEVEDRLQTEIFTQVVEDVYNKALVNW